MNAERTVMGHVNWTDKNKELFTHCIECSKKGKACPGWERVTGGCANGEKIK